MDDQTAKLIQGIATKLGTTADHLWAVLIRQAPISASCDAVGIALLGAALILAWRKILKWKPEDEPAKWIGVGLLSVITAILIALICDSIGEDIAGFVNPEYWALKQIIK